MVLLWIIRVQSQLTLLTRLKDYDNPLPFQHEALFVPNNKILSISCGRRQGLLSAKTEKNRRRMLLLPPKSQLTE